MKIVEITIKVSIPNHLRPTGEFRQAKQGEHYWDQPTGAVRVWERSERSYLEVPILEPVAKPGN